MVPQRGRQLSYRMAGFRVANTVMPRAYRNSSITAIFERTESIDVGLRLIPDSRRGQVAVHEPEPLGEDVEEDEGFAQP